MFRLNVAPGGISFDPFCPYPNSGGTITVLLPPTLIPSVIKYNAGGGFGAAWAENKPLGLSTNSRFRSLPGGDPTLNSYGCAMIRFPARSLDSLLETAVIPRYTQSKWT
uniref:Uncharacterized protein n=1 Tax=Opuntia streptacantha TaxID=393608 RepID=A0A7C9A6C7_OPUST